MAKAVYSRETETVGAEQQGEQQATTTTTKVKNVKWLQMWRRQIEVGHSF